MLGLAHLEKDMPLSSRLIRSNQGWSGQIRCEYKVKSRLIRYLGPIRLDKFSSDQFRGWGCSLNEDVNHHEDYFAMSKKGDFFHRKLMETEPHKLIEYFFMRGQKIMAANCHWQDLERPECILYILLCNLN